jgi:hypothetical protein
MVEQVYSHLGQGRHRSEVIEYRVEQHREVLGDRLDAFRGPAGRTSVTTTVTTASPST